MKILGMMMVFTSCSGLGLTFTYMYKKRLDQLCDWKKGIVLLKNEINFALTPLPEAFELIGKRLEGPISKFFIEIGNLLQKSRNKSMDQLDEKLLKKMIEDTCLNEKDKNLMIAFIKKLGLLDKESQINNLELHISELEQEIEKTRKEEEKNNKLYKTLGILSGIFVIVLFL